LRDAAGERLPPRRPRRPGVAWAREVSYRRWEGGDRMTSVWESLTVDARDPARLARWWAEALGYQVIIDRPDEVEIRQSPDRLPGLVFVPAPEDRQVKNRLHLDLRPTDQEAEIERLVDMGARHVDVGQGDGDWIMLADPEGNEFCVLRQRG
jgi:glyoxalase superfamily protein